VALAPSAVACSSDGPCQSIDAADSDIFKCNDHEAAPDSRAFEVEERERGTLCDFHLAAADRFLQQAADDPRIGRDSFTLKEQIGIDFSGKPLLGPVKCVVHDVSENLMCEKTSALARSKASEMRAARKKIYGMGAGDLNESRLKGSSPRKAQRREILLPESICPEPFAPDNVPRHV
jgi:hypothetical protein